MQKSPWLISALLASCASVPRAAPPVAPGLPVSTLEALASDAVAKAPLLGLQMWIARGDAPALTRAYGKTALQDSAPVDPETVLAIGSLTKSITASAVLALVDAGKVRLTDPVARYLPQVNPALTVAQLLNQTSGLPDFARPANLKKTRAELEAVIASAPLDFAPGTRWAYSNSNYFLLGRIIEVASGSTYDAFLAEHVFAPAGMKRSGLCVAGKNVAQGSMSTPTGLGPASPVSNDFYFAAGALCSTADDLARWADAVFGGKLLSPASLAFMTTPAALPDGTHAPYGAGLVIDQIGGHRRFWHNGAVPGGFEGELAYFPDDHLRVVLLANTLHNPPTVVLGKLDRALSKAALGIQDPPVQDLPLPADAEARYVGTFSLQGLAAAISVRAGKLHALIGGANDLELLNQGGDRFVVASNPSGMYRFVVEGGRAAAIELSDDGSVMGRLTRTSAP